MRATIRIKTTTFVSFECLHIYFVVLVQSLVNKEQRDTLHRAFDAITQSQRADCNCANIERFHELLSWFSSVPG